MFAALCSQPQLLLPGPAELCTALVEFPGQGGAQGVQELVRAQSHGPALPFQGMGPVLEPRAVPIPP